VFSRSLDPEPLERDPRERLPEEFRELVRNLADMARRLRSEHNQLEQVLQELESRVLARTSELEAALELAQSADRAKSAFLATVSHELRTPLTSIITGLHLLKESPGPRSEMEKRLLTTCEKSSQVLMGVINSVLDYSKLEAGGTRPTWAPLDPAALARDIIEMLKPTAQGAGLQLRLDCRLPAEFSWLGDAQHLRQILLNLVGNGLKFTSAGEVALQVWLETGTDGSRLHWAVRDTGPGIAPELQARVFEPFFQLATNRVRAHAGTGLGLPICRKLVALMGGELTLRSELGRGSTFHFWLPEVNPPALPAPAPHALPS
jgi:signal transduction histidine kinase